MSDLISRQAAIEAVETKIKKWNAVDGEGYHVGLGLRYTDVIDTLTELPSAQPEIRCRDCGHFHYDMPYVIQGVPVLGHEVCDFWGDGCKTSENGYCSFAERKTDGADVNT